jgi:hypothetical protein
VAVTTGEIMGWLRAGVGAGLLVWPTRFLRLSGREAPTPVAVLLMRTIGIRDLVLGVGTVAACRRGDDGDARRWTSAGLASDSLDVVASLVASGSIGRVESAGAAAAALVFAVGDTVALGSLRGASPSDGAGDETR